MLEDDPRPHLVAAACGQLRRAFVEDGAPVLSNGTNIAIYRALDKVLDQFAQSTPR